MTKIKIAILGALFLLLPVSSWAGWEYISSMPHGRLGHDSTVGMDGRIYVMGGVVYEINEDREMVDKINTGPYANLVYDPNQDFWTYLEPPPGAVTAHYDTFSDGTPSSPNTFYYGNSNDSWLIVNEVYGEKNLYEIIKGLERGKRITIDPEELRNTDFMRQGDGTQIVTARDGFIYWLGGRDLWIGHGNNKVLPFNPETNKWPRVWTEKYHPPREIPDDYPEELKKKLSQMPSNSVEYKIYYDTDIPPMQEIRLRHEAVVSPDGRVYVLGGYNYSKPGRRRSILDTMECYDPGKNEWTYLAPMLTKRMIFGAVLTSDDKIYVFGGSADYFNMKTGDQQLAATEVYDIKTDTWSSIAPMPEPRAGHAAVLVADGKIYIIGGSKAIRSEPLKTVFIYDPAKDSWSKGPDMNVPRSLVSAVATPDGKIYAIGGTDVGAYPKKEQFNFFLPEKTELYTGRVQETVEVLDISTLKQ